MSIEVDLRSVSLWIILMHYHFCKSCRSQWLNKNYAFNERTTSGEALLKARNYRPFSL